MLPYLHWISPKQMTCSQSFRGQFIHMACGVEIGFCGSQVRVKCRACLAVEVAVFRTVSTHGHGTCQPLRTYLSSRDVRSSAQCPACHNHDCPLTHPPLSLISTVIAPQQSFSCMCAKLLQLCPTLCNPMYCSPSGSSVLEIVQARKLEGAAVPSSRGSSPPSDQTCVSYISCIGRQVLYHQCHLGRPIILLNTLFLATSLHLDFFSLSGSCLLMIFNVFTSQIVLQSI